jgi:uncharacterized membrane protein
MKIGAVLVHLRTWFLQGIAFIAPVGITLAFLIWLGRSVENLMGELLRGVLPAEWYLPGMGLIIGILLTLTVGLLANLFLVRWIVGLAERILDRIPLVKSVFQGLKDIARLFSQGGDRELGRVVAVELQGVRLVGFVMQEHAVLPGVFSEEEEDNRLAVYLPMSYQVGGYTVYVPRDRVTALQVSAEEAMRAILTGGSLTKGEPADRRPSRAGAAQSVPASGEGSR